MRKISKRLFIFLVFSFAAVGLAGCSKGTSMVNEEYEKNLGDYILAYSSRKNRVILVNPKNDKIIKEFGSPNEIKQYESGYNYSFGLHAFSYEGDSYLVSSKGEVYINEDVEYSSYLFLGKTLLAYDESNNTFTFFDFEFQKIEGLSNLKGKEMIIEGNFIVKKEYGDDEEVIKETVYSALTHEVLASYDGKGIYTNDFYFLLKTDSKKEEYTVFNDKGESLLK